jgi:xanthine dehydrogenase accessory factor
LEKGINRELIRKVHAPIGLEIYADTPQEIAVSIMAEIIKERRTPGRSLE